MQLEIELTSLRKEKDEASKERRAAMETELAELKRALGDDEGAVAEGEARDPGHLAS